MEEALALKKDFSLAKENHGCSHNTRFRLLQKPLDGECSDDCQGKWFSATIDLLERHGILFAAFCPAIYTT